eukprot:1386971-Prymnesium_polylepis.1
MGAVMLRHGGGDAEAWRAVVLGGHHQPHRGRSHRVLGRPLLARLYPVGELGDVVEVVGHVGGVDGGDDRAPHLAVLAHLQPREHAVLGLLQHLCRRGVDAILGVVDAILGVVDAILG